MTVNICNKEIFRKKAHATRHNQLDLQAVQELQQIVVGPEAVRLTGM
jgi:hypothetical protein